jgi:hypothetical protein
MPRRYTLSILVIHGPFYLAVMKVTGDASPYLMTRNRNDRTKNSVSSNLEVKQK